MRRPGPFFWKLFLGNVLLMALGLGVTAWLIFSEVQRLHLEDLTSQLGNHASIIRPMVHGRLDVAHRDEIDELAKSVGGGGADGIRVTIVAADGSVLGDSERANPANLDNHRDRPEVIEAIRTGRGESRRYSQSVRREMKYVAVRVGTKNAPEGVVRAAMTVRTITERLGSAQRLIWRIAIGALIGVVLLALGLAILWSSRIQRITAIARSVSRGDLTARAPVSGSDEVAELGGSLNEMREKLAGQLSTIDRQRKTLEALLAQLQEAVIVAGSDGRIVLCNPSAQRLLCHALPARRAQSGWTGRAVEECVPYHDLQEMLDPSPRTGGDNLHGTRDERRVKLRSGTDTIYLLARASDITLPAPEPDGSSRPASRDAGPGRILALTDVTELERTIQIKADFAANASHELRTPLSVIRAAVETVLSLDAADDPQAGRHFLESISRQARRLEALVNDLLDLSRLESESEPHEPEPVNIHDLLDEVRDRYRETIERKGIRFDTPPIAPAEADAGSAVQTIFAPRHLLALVIDNLVSNAVKFTPAGGSVTVECARRGEDVGISVADTGCGISPAEQSRVFERFYQVERARTGGDEPNLRGTGLGLSIVRHAVAAMGGRIDLQSEVGKGTRVEIHLPRAVPG